MDQADDRATELQQSKADERVSAIPAREVIRRLLEKESALRGFVRQRVDSEALAEDLLQEAFVRAVERQHSLRDEESVAPWFQRVLRNTIVDYYRSRAAQSRRNDAFLQELTQRGEDKEPSLDEMTSTVCECLHDILPALRFSYTHLLRRIDLDGESPVQVAKDLNITQNNLTVRLHRARQALRARLEQACGVCSTHGCLNCSCE